VVLKEKNKIHWKDFMSKDLTASFKFIRYLDFSSRLASFDAVGIA